MSRTFVFQNPGVIDPLSITTFGVSSKADKSTAIGFFGTGLKYAIAVILRTGGSITIHSGEDTYEFGVQTAKVRNDEFSVVTMYNASSYRHGEPRPLGFTTELGKTWEQWQAFRELYCNMLDEGGTSYESSKEDYIHRAGYTTIVVSGTEFAKAWDARHEVILDQSSAPIAKNDDIQLYPGPGKHVYYRGIRVFTPPRPTLYTYNITHREELTEDRTLKYAWRLDGLLVSFTKNDCKDPEILDAFLLSDREEALEGSLYYSGKPSEELAARVAYHAKRFERRLNQSARSMCHESVIKHLADAEPFNLDLTDQKRMQIARAFCKKVGFDVDKYPIKVTEHLGEGVMGLASNGTIYIAKRTLTMGTKQLVGTLIEEYLHLSTGCIDESRSMQNLLIDTIVSLGERLTKRPL